MSLHRVVACRLPKPDGAESQDAVADAREAGLFAVADGVTHRSFMAGAFAQRMVDTFVALPGTTLDMIFNPNAAGVAEHEAGFNSRAIGLKEFGRRLAEAWQSDVERVQLDDAKTVMRNAWKSGDVASMATFAGLRIQRQGEAIIADLMIVGDCFIFIGGERGFYRYTGAGEGSRSSHVTASVAVKRGSQAAMFCEPLIETNMCLSPDSQILLATDQAGWWIGEANNERMLSTELRAIRAKSDLVNWIKGLRKEFAAPEEVDDLTAMLIELGPVPEIRRGEGGGPEPMERIGSRDPAFNVTTGCATSSEKSTHVGALAAGDSKSHGMQPGEVSVRSLSIDLANYLLNGKVIAIEDGGCRRRYAYNGESIQVTVERGSVRSERRGWSPLREWGWPWSLPRLAIVVSSLLVTAFMIAFLATKTKLGKDAPALDSAEGGRVRKERGSISIEGSAAEPIDAANEISKGTNSRTGSREPLRSAPGSREMVGKLGSVPFSTSRDQGAKASLKGKMSGGASGNTLGSAEAPTREGDSTSSGIAQAAEAESLSKVAFATPERPGGPKEGLKAVGATALADSQRVESTVVKGDTSRAVGTSPRNGAAEVVAQPIGAARSINSERRDSTLSPEAMGGASAIKVDSTRSTESSGSGGGSRIDSTRTSEAKGGGGSVKADSTRTTEVRVGANSAKTDSTRKSEVKRGTEAAKADSTQRIVVKRGVNAPKPVSSGKSKVMGGKNSGKSDSKREPRTKGRVNSAKNPRRPKAEAKGAN